MMTFDQLVEIVSEISYKPGWAIHLHRDAGRPYVQLTAVSIDSVTHVPCDWKSGKSYLSVHMCRQEIVGAVFGLIRAAEEHEMREFFRYKGASIYNPHLDPDALVLVAKRQSSFNMRDNAMTMVEGSSS